MVYYNPAIKKEGKGYTLGPPKTAMKMLTDLSEEEVLATVLSFFGGHASAARRDPLPPPTDGS